MTISNVTDEALKRVLAENLTPSDSIRTPDRLFGREKTLLTIDRAFNSPGRQIFIYGDRGVGHRYSWMKNKRSPFVNWTRPRTLRRNTIS